MSWLYLSRLSAMKEFAYMKVLLINFKLLTEDIYGFEVLAFILAFLNHFSKILKLILKTLGLIYRKPPLKQVPKVRLPIGDLVVSDFSLFWLVS